MADICKNCKFKSYISIYCPARICDIYSLNLVAGEQEINQAGFEDALNQLNDILGFYKSLDSGNKLLQK